MGNIGGPRTRAVWRRVALAVAVMLTATVWSMRPHEGVEARAGTDRVQSGVARMPDAPADETTLLVRYDAGAPEAERRRALGVAGAVERGRLLGAIAVLEVPAGQRGAALRALVADPAVVAAQPNYLVGRDVAPDDPYFNAEWGLANTGQLRGIVDSDIDADEAWDLTTGSTGAVVAIIDDGLDYTHPDLAANAWSAPVPDLADLTACPAGTHGYDTVSHDCDPMPAADDIHGTHVAGIIGAAANNAQGIAGVNWQASLLAIRALTAGGGTTVDILEAFDWIVKAKDSGVNVRVVNASWGCMCQHTTVFDSALGDLAQRDILFVAAAGNSSTDNDGTTTPAYPCVSSAPNVVCVAASDTYDRLASFSNFGNVSVDLAAPGDWIVSTVPPLADGTTYTGLSGTSMAAPHVTGAAALVLSREALDVTSLRERLLATVDTVPELADLVATGGRLNVCRALGCTPRTDFSPALHVAPSVFSVAAGSSARFYVDVAATRTSGTMSLGATGVPRGVRLKFDPSSIDAGEQSTVTVTVGRSAKRGTTTFTVTATDGTWSLEAPVTITIT